MIAVEPRTPVNTATSPVSISKRIVVCEDQKKTEESEESEVTLKVLSPRR